MMDRKAILKQYQEFIDADGVFIKTIDQLYQAESYFETQTTEFLTPDISYIIEQIVKKHTDLTIKKVGVFSNPERVKLILLSEFAEDVNLEEVVALIDIKYNQKFNNLEHRDALGALMALGIKRSKLGDIVVYDGGFQVVVDKSLLDYFLSSVEKIGRAGVSVRQIDFGDAKEKIDNSRQISGTVKSIRLDSIIALCYQLSRTEAQKLIESEFVKVNHIVTDRSDYSPKEKDMISVRGYGRLVVEEILGVTKKDRIRIVLSVMSR